MARVGIVLGSEAIKIVHSEKGILYSNLSYVNWDNRKQDIISIGFEAKKLLDRIEEPLEIIPIFENDDIKDSVIFEKLFNKIFVPLKADLENNDIVISWKIGSSEKSQKKVEEMFSQFKINSLNFVPTILLAAVGSDVDINDDYGTIILNIDYQNTTAAIISRDKIISYSTIPYANNYLNNEIHIFFKKQFQIIISDEETERVKHYLASIGSGKQNIQLVITGKDLMKNSIKEILVNSSDVKKVFTNLFSNYRAMITSLLESSPANIRTGITKNGLSITGELAKIYGVKEYFTDFFEFPTWINSQAENAVSNGTLEIGLNLLKKDPQKFLS